MFIRWPSGGFFCNFVSIFHLFRRSILQSFEGLPRLQVLSLHGSALPAVTGPAWQALTQLQSLNLSANALTAFSPASFSAAADTLSTLDLSNNPRLASLTGNSFASFSALKALCLSQVPLDCCGLEDLRDSGVVDGPGCQGLTVCAAPPIVAGQRLSNTTGVICPPAKKAKVSNKELAIIAGSGGGAVLLLLIVILVVVSRRRHGSHVLSEASHVQADERTALVKRTSDGGSVVFEEA